MYFCQFSELAANTYVGHRRLLCRGGRWSTWSYLIFPPFRPSPMGGGHYQFWGVKIPSPELHWYWYCLKKKKFCILEASNKNKNFKQFRRNEKFCYEPWAPLVMQLNDIMVARIWFLIMHVFMAMIPESLL